ncbi:metallopeptidase family protein [Alloscardovia theropitheci]|uniref:Metallopeptidase family protein n=1 Tax=Alloscardovia theropitheci TaxID=2496842 RepID=A0A4R0QY19_9BIFI|nr:metallopeptidase family protein [Alloscardovia theropitheci]TCD54610.1 metallopeptidase family protein [Alloscardovia theropitheci]
MSNLPWDNSTYRNRHGRGIRRPVFGARLPRYRTATGYFDNQVLAQVERLKRAWPSLLNRVEFAVEDVPPSHPLAWEHYSVALSQNFPAAHGIPARIALYRKPIEARAHHKLELQLIIREQIVQQLSNLYGLSPKSIDPTWNDEF